MTGRIDRAVCPGQSRSIIFNDTPKQPVKQLSVFGDGWLRKMDEIERSLPRRAV